MKLLTLCCCMIVATSCSTRSAFHRNILAGDICPAMYFAVHNSLYEVADLFIAEFDRLQGGEPETVEIRLQFLVYATEHFPPSEIGKLFPLLRKGCLDSDKEVRDLAMGLFGEYFPDDVVTDLRNFSEDASLEARAHILRRIEELSKEKEGAPNRAGGR